MNGRQPSPLPYQLVTAGAPNLPARFVSNLGTTARDDMDDGGYMSEHSRLTLPSHEELSKLARDDPPAYEALRREIIDDFIDHAPDKLKPRLLGLQFRVDSLRRLSRSALGSTVKIYDLMWKSFVTLNYQWQEFVHMEAPLPGQCALDGNHGQPERSARILQFRPVKRHRE